MADDSSFWLKFFREAGIPDSHACSYAEVFEDNRIRSDMLQELNKDILQEMGVAHIGDVIAILRQAKQSFAKQQRLVQKSSSVKMPASSVTVVAPAPVAAAPAATATATHSSIPSVSISQEKLNSITKVVTEFSAKKDAIERKKTSRLQALGGSHGMLNPEGDFVNDPPPMEVDENGKKPEEKPKEKMKKKKSLAAKLSEQKSPPQKEHVSVHERLGGKMKKPKNNKKSSAAKAGAPSIFSRLGASPGGNGAKSSNGRQVTIQKSKSKGSVFDRLNS